MSDSTKMGWIFFVLALIFGWIASNPRMRKMLAWGQTKSAVPMSMVGLCAWIGSFLLISAVAFDFLPWVTVFAPVPILAIAGCYDSYHSRSKNNQTTQRVNARKR